MIRDLSRILLLLLTACGITTSRADGKTFLHYSSPPGIDALNVAYVVTRLRGKDLETVLPTDLRALCPTNPRLSNYKIWVYGDSEGATIARRRIGQIPNLNDPEWVALQKALLASYDPLNGVLEVRVSSDSDAGMTFKRLAIGKSWCSS